MRGISGPVKVRAIAQRGNAEERQVRLGVNELIAEFHGALRGQEALIEPHVHDGHLVHGQSARLVRTNNIGGAESLDSVHALHEHVFLCQAVAGNRQARRDSRGQTLETALDNFELDFVGGVYVLAECWQ